MKKVFFLFLAFGFFSSGCKKGDGNGNSTCPISMATLVGSYKITAYTTQATSSSGVVDFFATYQPCERDDIVTLKTDGTYSWAEGATACSPSSVLPPGTWSVSGTTITIDGTPGTATFDCKTLVIKSTGTTNIETTTLVRQ